MTKTLTRTDRRALDLLDVTGRLAGVAQATRSKLERLTLIEWTGAGFVLTRSGLAVLDRPICDHCGERAVWLVDLLAYDGDMLERLRYCTPRLRERLAEDGIEQIGAVRRIGTENLHVINGE